MKILLPLRFRESYLLGKKNLGRQQKKLVYQMENNVRICTVSQQFNIYSWSFFQLLIPWLIERV